MIYSMTGYGRCETEENHRKVTVEISAINHRYLDINIRMPKILAHFEDELRKIVKQKIARGKLDINIYYQSTAEEDIEIMINENLCKAYVDGFTKIADIFGVENDMKLSHLMQMGDLLIIQKKSGDNDEVSVVLKKALESALEELQVMRHREGEALKTDIFQKVKDLSQLIEAISSRSYLIVDEYKKKLEARIAVLLENIAVDPSRMATEVAFFADKCAVDEELTRLKSHIKQLVNILEEDGVVGRKLDFLMQEINREANTIGSKANDYAITKHVVSLKTEVEKIREQVQNLE